MTSGIDLGNRSRATTILRERFGARPMHLTKLDYLVDYLVEETKNQNLISKGTIPTLWTRHFLDSAQLLSHVPRETSRWADIGSGAGFPGLVIAILRPNWTFTLIEERRRRVDWLENAKKKLGLKNVSVHHAKVQTFRPSGAFDVISARAVATLENLIAWSSHLADARTTWVLPKGKAAVDEIEALSGWNHTFHVEQSITDPESGIIIGQLGSQT